MPTFNPAWDANWTNTSINSSAVTTFESAGAPLRLTDADITNLTNTMSVYGYAAIASIDPKAMVKVANPLD